MSRCTACGNILRTTEYQSRSADEATEVVTECISCPIKSDKLSFSRNITPVTSGLVLPVRTKRRSTLQLHASASFFKYRLRVSVPKQSHDHTDALFKHVVVRKLVKLHKNVNSPTTTSVCDVSLSGPWGEECILASTSTEVGLNCVVERLEVTRDVRIEDVDMKVNVGLYTEGPQVLGYQSAVYIRGNHKDIVVDIGNKASVDLTGMILEQVYLAGYCPQFLSDVVQTSTLMQYNSLSARAWDSSTPPASGHMFTCKPDGERAWLVKRGIMWYLVPKDKTRHIRSWKASRHNTGHSNMWVLDIEYVFPNKFIFIDCITDTDYNPAPITRDLDWSIGTITSILSIDPTCSVFIREYFRNFDDARSYSATCGYPTDGVVAIRDGSTEILKLKDVRSMELEAKGGDNLSTSDGTAVVPNIWNHPLGSIVELRFTATEVPQFIRVWSSVPRTDKGTGNSIEAVENILNSSNTSGDANDSSRRAVLLWCNKLRDTIKNRATMFKSPKRVVLDVGTGTGQSIDSMIRQDDISYILVEPDTEKCKAISRRLGRARVVHSITEVLPVLRSMQTRSTQHVVVNATISSVISDRRSFGMLSPMLRCVTATFSMQFDLQSMHSLSSEYRLPVFGCSYVYDGARSDGTLIDAYDVCMRVNDGSVAKIKWGTDEEYTEPVTYRAWYHGLGNVVQAIDLVPVSTASSEFVSMFAPHIVVVVA